MQGGSDGKIMLKTVCKSYRRSSTIVHMSPLNDCTFDCILTVLCMSMLS